MNELELKKLRSQFIAAVGHLLADEGVRFWQGEAAAHKTGPKDRILCINNAGELQDVSVHDYDPGQVANPVDLARIKMNWGYRLPARVRDLRPPGRGMKLELTCRADDLLDLACHVADVMLGRASAERNYVWDPRAAEGLLPQTQAWFKRLGFLRPLPAPARPAANPARPLRRLLKNG